MKERERGKLKQRAHQKRVHKQERTDGGREREGGRGEGIKMKSNQRKKLETIKDILKERKKKQLQQLPKKGLTVYSAG